MAGAEIPLDFDSSDEEDAPLLQDTYPPAFIAYPSSFLHLREATSPRTIIAILFALIFILSFGGNLMTVPSMRLYEDIMCHHYYNGLQDERHIAYEGHIDEELCKVEEVQNELNVVFAGLRVLGAIPSLVLTIPYGFMMDRVGRKPVFLLSLLGIIMSASWDMMVMRFWRIIPFRLVWVAPIFTIVGGGEAVAAMMFYTIGSDVTTEANRANVFMFGACAGLSAELVGPIMASALMVKSPWIPILLGAAVLVFGTILINFIPETLNLRANSEAPTPESRSEISIKLGDSILTPSIKSQLHDSWKSLAESVTILNSIPVILLLATFVVAPFSGISSDLSVRFVSNRFAWSLSHAGYLLALRALMNIIVMLGLIPGLSSYFMKRLRLSSKDKDLLLAKISIVVLAMGAFIIAASPTIGLTIIGLMVWTLGTGFVSLTRSLITTLVDEQHVGRLYAAVSIVETVGALIAGPLLAASYNLGLRWKGAWVGLPYFLLSLVSFIAAVEIWIFGCTTRKSRKNGMLYGDEDGDAQCDTLLMETDLLG